jgi:hypothetical protein
MECNEANELLWSPRTPAHVLESEETGMRQTLCKLSGGAIGVALAVTTMHAANSVAVPIPDRAKGADRVVVATVTDAQARYEISPWGDRIIVTHAHLAVEEALKGTTESAALAVEGGTVGGMTLHVSSLPTIAPGDRGVFFLKRGANGEFTPHLRGQGILGLDASNHVRGSGLSLEDVRRMVHGTR